MDTPEIIPVIEDVWRCDVCGHETTNKSYLAVHMAYTHQDFKLFKSVQSDHGKVEEGTKSDNVKAKSDVQKAKSDNTKANAKVRCKKCPFTTTTVADVKLHIKRVHKKGINKCWYCDFTALIKDELTEHMNTHGYNTLANAGVEPTSEKGDSDSKYPTKETSHTESGPDSVVSVVLTPKNYDTGSTTTPLNLVKESTQEITTEGERIGNFKCDQCSYTTTILSILERHKRYAHTQKVRNFPCNHCEHRAVNETALRVHVTAVHDKVRNYKCDYCGITTARKANLMSHIAEVHEKIRKYR